MAARRFATAAKRIPISTFSSQKEVQHMIKKLRIFDAEIAYIDTGRNVVEGWVSIAVFNLTVT